MLRIQKISVIAAFLLLIWSFALTLPGSPAIHLIITLVSIGQSSSRKEERVFPFLINQLSHFF